MTTAKNRAPLREISNGMLNRYLDVQVRRCLMSHVMIPVSSTAPPKISTNPDDNMTVEDYLQKKLNEMIKVTSLLQNCSRLPKRNFCLVVTGFYKALSVVARQTKRRV